MPFSFAIELQFGNSRFFCQISNLATLLCIQKKDTIKNLMHFPLQVKMEGKVTHLLLLLQPLCFSLNTSKEQKYENWSLFLPL